MQYLIVFLGAVIVPLIPSIVRGLVSYVAVSVGFSLVAYTGMSAAIDKLVDYAQRSMDGLPSDMAAIIAMSGFPEAFNAFLTCMVFSFTLSGMMKSTGYRPSWRKPSDPNSL
ncbi:DUF2523 domain-containing protein [Vibrio anguillarum]|uniref:DUF2523 domain-containing protein n=1 Tax=Vibrio anguillarum TaxID=55601 RepID=UPI00097E2F96|nr:DUF2523 domain-containing protein [Vibrio anguillarum]MBT2911836.1 DUF2523 domain-containing protein [Vibrio anguillarum]MBT2944077.1 DUF2523 domain-containing protein [Vibrio anguillarum]MBT2951562.1 DUF2523 domain-containing protein [Vibrio anguillarum]